jgi:hypothetical protein
VRRRLLEIACVGLLLVVACSSFEDAPGTASDGGVPDGGADGSTDASQSACVPEPAEPFDSGQPESDKCGPNGAGVALSIDPANCGFCGNACGDGQCLDGMCRAPAVFTGDFEQIVGDAIQDTGLYFVTSDKECAGLHIRRVTINAPADKGASELLSVPGGCAGYIGAHGDNLYYVRSSSGLHYTVTATPSFIDPPLVNKPGNVGIVYLAPSAMFVADGTGTGMSLVSYEGVVGDAVYSDGNAKIDIAVGDGDDLWWTSTPLSGAQDSDALWTRNAKSKSSLRPVSNLARISALAIDAEYIYLGFTSGEIKRYRRDSGAIDSVTRIEGARAFPRALVVAGDSLFIFGGDGMPPTNGDMVVYRAKKCGGRARAIAAGYMYHNNVVRVGQHLYYGDSASVRRLDVSRWVP